MVGVSADKVIVAAPGAWDEISTDGRLGLQALDRGDVVLFLLVLERTPLLSNGTRLQVAALGASVFFLVLGKVVETLPVQLVCTFCGSWLELCRHGGGEQWHEGRNSGEKMHGVNVTISEIRVLRTSHNYTKP